ncbi:MAG: UbiA family prenyltransferase [Chlorobiaceae bacterium]|nr:UbiA family prenyltransferase [Chlorobiaceae bacterium]
MVTPLVVDLDGTLIRTDLLYQSLFSFIKERPLQLLAPFFWLAKGKSHLKTELANRVSIDVSVLPYEPAVIALIEGEKAKQRPVILATASHKIYADQIAEHLNLFDRVIATDGSHNISSHAKRDVLVEEFGHGGFDYAGNSHADVPVWESAGKAYLVNPERGVEKRAMKKGNVERVIKSSSNQFALWLKALRPHQWMKNLLIFVPLLAAHDLFNSSALLLGLLGFVFFSLCASSVYLLNDLLDLEDDRHHPKKRNRMLASGTLSIKTGTIAIPLLLLVPFAGSMWLMPWRFSLVLGIYYVATLAYSLVLKKVTAADIIVLSLLYTIRILAGVYACSLTPTFWMLAFSMFIFLSLALVKRYSELRDARVHGNNEKAKGRGYYPDDLEMISSLGAASGYLSVMVLALYIQDNATVAMYRQPQIIWAACPVLLFWITRLWLLTNRGEMHADPVIYAVTDKISILSGLIFGIIFWLAL